MIVDRWIGAEPGAAFLQYAVVIDSDRKVTVSYIDRAVRLAMNNGPMETRMAITYEAAQALHTALGKLLTHTSTGSGS